MARRKSIIVVDPSYQNLSEKYQDYLLRLGYHPHSSRSRFHYTNEFLHWLEQKGELDISIVDQQKIKDYYGYISSRPSKKDGGTLSLKTTHSHMQNLRGLFDMLLIEGRIKSHPMSTLTFPYPSNLSRRIILSQSEIQVLYGACERAQERAILSLAYGCGLRVSELVKCNMGDIKLREKILIVPNGKGRKRRVVPMSSGVVVDLADYYYKEREGLTKGKDYRQGEKAFMLHSRGGRMQKWTYNKYLKRIIERTGNEVIGDKQITIHHLRHSIATHLIEQGISIQQVRQFLGHSQLETTQIYTHISQAQLKDLMT